MLLNLEIYSYFSVTLEFEEDTKKGKNIAVIMPFDEFIKQEEKALPKNGLILAQGSLADLADLDSFLEDIYKAREESFERTVKVNG